MESKTVKSDYVIEQLETPGGLPNGFECRFKIKPSGVVEFLTVVGPYLITELNAGQVMKLPDGRTYLKFRLDQAKGEIIMEHLLAVGREMTPEEIAQRQAEEQDYKEVKESLIIPYRASLN